MFAPIVALALAGFVAAQSTIPGCAREYTVQEGDYCDKISAAHNVSSYQLAVSNYKTINDGCTNLVPGQVICLGETGADCAQTYSVQSGDYCDLIASNHGTNTTMLQTNNPQIDDNCYNLYVGQVLCVANEPLVTPAPAGWTPPGSNLDDGDFADNVPDNSASTTTTTTAAATTTTKAASSNTDNTSNDTKDDTKDDSKDDTKDDSKDDSKDDTKDGEEEEGDDDEDCEDY